MTLTNNIVIVKLGGAAITDKKGLCELAPESQLNVIFDQVKAAYQVLSATNNQLILIHGAGSYGHPQAAKYQLKSGWRVKGDRPDADYRKGYSHIRTCVQRLSYAIVSRLEERDIPVLALSPMDYIETDDGSENTPTSSYEILAHRTQHYLNLGFVPVLHGDAVLDGMRGCTILSGDVLMYQLSILLPVTRCVFITDVCGIYKADPKLGLPQSSQLILHVEVAKEFDYTTQHASTVDVTGGMQGKIKWAKKIVTQQQKKKIDSIICKWGSKEALEMMILAPCLTQERTPISGYAMTVFT